MGTRYFSPKTVPLLMRSIKGRITAFEEDRYKIEAQHQKLREQARLVQTAIVADQGLIQFRRLLEQRVEQESARD